MTMSTQDLWYLARGSGIVTLVLLSATVVLGLAVARRTESPSVPRFAYQELHRRLSLISVVFLAVHIATAVTDPFAPIGWLAAIVPFDSTYRRMWLGLGAVSVDLFVAVVVSSLFRSYLAPRVWRAVHWLAYGSWPVAVFHALGTGTDARLGWFDGVVVACVGAVAIAASFRLAYRWPEALGTRTVAVASGGAVAIAGTVWAVHGPLRPGWAARAGTPPSLLGGNRASSGATTHGGTPNGLPAAPYVTAIQGTLTQTFPATGVEQIVIRAVSASAAVLKVELSGAPAPGGGVYVSRTNATYGGANAPDAYRGSVVSLEDRTLVVALTGTRLPPLRLDVVLASSAPGALRGTLAASLAPGSARSFPAGEGDR